MTKKAAKPKAARADRPIVILVRDACPHCNSAEGYIKTRGSHREHLCEASGTYTRWFYVDCKECQKPFLLAEKTLLSEVDK